MGHRLTAVATRTGDDGSTGLGDGSRVPKTDPRIAALGDVDELNSTIGLLVAVGVGAHQALLAGVQQDLFDLGGELCIPGHAMLASGRVAALDAWIAEANAGLPRLREFVLPGGSLAAAQAHVCRTVCRRAERSLVGLGAQSEVSAAALQYLNRLSDLLFVLARLLNREAGRDEPQWQRE